ncbi:MAG: SPOR domain-containing protein [Agarilytica sp.]
MPRHHKVQASRTTEPARIPAWVWLFTGAILGAFVMFLLHLSEVSPGETSRETPKQTKQEKQKPRFDFYELLKESDIPILTESEHDANQQPQQNGPEVEYLLQVASFKSKGDAEQLRAQLLLLNLEAYTENAKIRNGETWHRVLVGPFKSKSKLSKARSILLSNRHEALVLKRQP